MLHIYIVEQKVSPDTDYSSEVNEIISINPDKIVCLCMNEVEAQLIFRNFFDRIKPWLRANNKIVNLVVPHLDNVLIEDGLVRAERTYGYALYHILTYYGAGDPTPPALPQQYLHFHNTTNLLFTCYNHKNNSARAQLVDMLAKENLLQDGIVTYHYPENATWKYHTGIKLTDEPDYEFHNQDKPQYNPTRLPTSMMRGFFDIVPESRYDANEYFMTEKTLKSILTLRPFITLSSTGYSVEYLEKYIELELYDEMFDYTFDSCTSLNDRVDGIINNVIRLKRILPDDRTKHSMYKKLLPKLIRNRNRIIEIFFDKTRIVPDCLRILMSGTPYMLHGSINHPMIHHMRNMEWMSGDVMLDHTVE